MSIALDLFCLTVEVTMPSAAELSVFFGVDGWVKPKDFFVYWKPGSQNRGDYFAKHHPPHHHREICATYLYMANALHKIDQNIVHKWANAVLTPIHTVAFTPVHTVAIRQDRTVLQECANVVGTYRHTNTKTVT